MSDTISTKSSSEERFDSSPDINKIASASSSYGRFPWRAFWFGLIFTPICVHWIEMTEVIVHAADLAAMSLVMSVVAYLLLLIICNRIAQKFIPKYAFTQSELMLIYTMNATTVGICGIGGQQFLVSTLAAPEHF
jgi:hypothetical protein